MRGFLVGLVVGVLGVTVIYLSRWGALLFAVCSVTLGIFTLYSMSSATSHVPLAVFVGYAVFAFLPTFLVWFGWPSLR
jgi:hypothetical protein